MVCHRVDESQNPSAVPEPKRLLQWSVMHLLDVHKHHQIAMNNGPKVHQIVINYWPEVLKVFHVPCKLLTQV